jgi:hypothetical protein
MPHGSRKLLAHCSNVRLDTKRDLLDAITIAQGNEPICTRIVALRPMRLNKQARGRINTTA